jgi:hypothetical protein
MHRPRRSGDGGDRGTDVAGHGGRLALISLPLDEVLRDPKRLTGLSQELLTEMLARCGAAQGVITAAIIRTAALSKKSGLEREELKPKTKMLNVEEAAEMLHVKRRWLFRNAGRYPFIHRLSQKKLLISEKGLREWLASRT